MPSLGPAEILVILVIALLVFGPNKLPDMAKQAGKAFQELRRVQQHLRSEISGAMSDLDGSSQSASSQSGSSQSGSAPSGDPVPMLPALDPDAAPTAESVMPPPPSQTTPPAATPPPAAPAATPPPAAPAATPPPAAPAATPPPATPAATDPPPPSSPPPADPA